MRQCSLRPAHAHIGNECPLCTLEVQNSTLLFIGPAAAIGAALDLVAAWARIMAVPSPGPAPRLPDMPTVTATLELPEGYGGKQAAAIAIIGVLAGFAVMTTKAGAAGWWVIVGAGIAAAVVWPQVHHSTVKYAMARTEARVRLQELEKLWDQTGDQSFQEKFRALTAALDRLRALEVERLQRIHDAKSNLRQNQFDHHLRMHSIARARIEGIGPKHINTLRAFKIETAFDIDEFALGWVYAFGTTLRGNLAAWRKTVERSFRFDPARGVYPADLEAIEREIAAKRQTDEQLLRLGPVALKAVSEHALQSRLQLMPQIQEAQTRLAQADANLKAAG